MMRIGVTADNHSTYDDWVVERATEEAQSNGMVLGKYRGLVDERDTTGYYYHWFDASPEWDREWNA